MVRRVKRVILFGLATLVLCIAAYVLLGGEPALDAGTAMLEKAREVWK